jgi:hypothetical protein
MENATEANMAKRENLEKKAATLSKYLGKRYVIDFAACYGGYCLDSEDGKQRITSRMPLQQMNSWLDGAIAALDLQKRLAINTGTFSLDELERQHMGAVKAARAERQGLDELDPVKG